MSRFWTGLCAVAVVCSLSILGGDLHASGEEAVTASSLFGRAELLYRQLSAVDPQCEDPRSWGSLALAFAEIPARFPDDDLAADALWRLGDIHSRQLAGGLDSAHEHAEAAYRRILDRYPLNGIAPAAMLRLAELGSARAARGVYFQLVDRYPGTPEAGEARIRLARRDAEGATPASNAPPAAPPTPASRNSDTSSELLDEVLEAEPTPASGTASSTSAEATSFEAIASSGRVTGIRHYSDSTHTRVVFDLDRGLDYQMGEAKDPPRLYVDLVGADIPATIPKTIVVDGTGVMQIRVGVNRPGIVRAVLELRGKAEYSLFTLANPTRLVVDVAGPEMSRRLAGARRPAAPAGGAEARVLNLGIRKIMIDPGHGGGAPGAIGRSGATEKDLALDIARRLAANLRGSNYDVDLTRDDDRDVALEDRPLRAAAAQADLFVSIHVNSANNRSLSGFETYYLDLATDPTAAAVAARENAAAHGGMGQLDDVLDEIVRNANKRESRDLAHSIQDSLVLQTSKQYDGVRDLGVKQAPFVVLVGAGMPAVLIECSFLSNTNEEQRLTDAAYRQQLADAIHIGIENYAARRRMMTTADR